MIGIPGYEMGERIHRSERTVVRRCVRVHDGAPVIVKAMAREHPLLTEMTRFRREHEILSGLTGDGVVRVYDLEHAKSRLAIVMEDLGAESLQARMAGGRLDLREALEIGVQLAGALDQVHRRGVIHKNLNPGNIIVVPGTTRAKLIDFGIATMLRREEPLARSPGVMEGTLAYISPEQTGRMNRALDYRTDLYSLGVTLYEMLTGATPFQAADPLELVHFHLARAPIAPHELAGDIPRAVSEIVLKLLAKPAEDRYQSGHGLRADLEACLAEWGSPGAMVSFVPGRHDAHDRLQIPQRLYGREAAIDVLTATFERASRGAAELLLVAGPPGVGKSALVNEVHLSIVRKRGYFISGKFDQLQRDLPYSALIQAFGDLIRQLLTEGEEELDAWRARLARALGPNARVIADVIPEVELILGKSPPVQALPPKESEHRWNFVFQQFIGAFTAEAHPLVVFLDDLQWADIPSIKLIQRLALDPEARCLLVIGAYRDNEVTGAHPLLRSLDEIAAAGAEVTRVSLAPLGLAHVAELIEDALRCGADAAQGLAAPVIEKTGGNPFFLRQFLMSLHEDGLLAFDVGEERWRWDPDRIRSKTITDNVVELMAGKIQRLSGAAQHVVELAACIGGRFTLGTLAHASEQPTSELAAGVWEALEEGLLLMADGACQFVHAAGVERAVNETPHSLLAFLHDRVQQAAYSLIPDEVRSAVHLRLGRLLLRSTPEAALPERIFDIVDQLNRGLDRLVDPDERHQAAELNLLAGRRAKASAAHEPARRYLAAGLRLLQEGAFRERYELAFALHAEAIEEEYVNADFAAAERLSTLALAEARTTLDAVQIHASRVHFHVAQQELAQAITIALQALELLGVTFPPLAGLGPSHVREALGRTQTLLAGRRPAELVDLPPMTDPGKLAAIRLLSAACGPAYLSGSPLFALLSCELVNLSLEHGSSPHSPAAYAAHGIIQMLLLGDIETSNAFGDLALALLDRAGSTTIRASVLFQVNTWIRVWRLPLRALAAPLLEAIQCGMEVGDVENAAYATAQYCTIILHQGDPLEAVVAEHDRYLGFLRRLKHEFQEVHIRVARQLASNLMGRAANPLCLTGESFDEEAGLRALEAVNNRSVISHVHTYRGVLAYLFGDPGAALAAFEAAVKCRIGPGALVTGGLVNLYHSLTLLALARAASPTERAPLLERVERNQVDLRRWAEHAPATYRHKLALVEAERARLLGRTEEASAHYEQAIQGAAQNRYLHEEALATEHAAEFYLSLGRERIGAAYLAEAHHGYLRWGARAKVAELERRYPQLLGGAPDASGARAVQTTTEGRGTVLDLAAVMKAAQAIARELELAPLLDIVMRTVLENAGARRALLLLEKNGKFEVEADERVADAAPGVRGGLSTAIIHYVARTKETVILSDAAREGLFTADPYVSASRARSVLCAPLLNQGKIVAIIYVENDLVAGAFTADRLEVLRLLSAQAALSIHNATLFASLRISNERLEDHLRTLEQKVDERTRALSRRNEELGAALRQVSDTQDQLVSQAKLASLGALTAGIAHELKNPLNFINNFAESSAELVDELAESLATIRGRIDAPTSEGMADVIAYLKDNSVKINAHGKRANGIIEGMLLHSRRSGNERESAELNAVIAESVRFARDAARSKDLGADPRVDDDYDAAVGLVEMVVPDIRRVVINLLNNALYATGQKRRAVGPSYDPLVQVSTRSLGDRVEIRIRDNGTGIPADFVGKIFNPFFTTKPAGEGTGLGLSLSHDMVVQGHLGELTVTTVPGESTEFIVVLPRSSPAVARRSPLAAQ